MSNLSSICMIHSWRLYWMWNQVVSWGRDGGQLSISSTEYFFAACCHVLSFAGSLAFANATLCPSLSRTHWVIDIYFTDTFSYTFIHSILWSFYWSNRLNHVFRWKLWQDTKIQHLGGSNQRPWISLIVDPFESKFRWSNMIKPWSSHVKWMLVWQTSKQESSIQM